MLSAIYSYFGYHWWYLYYFICNTHWFIIYCVTCECLLPWVELDFFQGNVLLESRWIWNWPARKVWMLSVNDALSCVELRWFKYYLGRVWIQSIYNRECLRHQTTDARWGNNLHCTDENQIPIPKFLGTAEYRPKYMIS